MESLEDLMVPIDEALFDNCYGIFIEFFASVLIMCGLANQTLLSKRAHEELFFLVNEKKLTPEAAMSINVTQAAFSDILRRRLKPTYNQLIIWFRTIIRMRNSANYRKGIIEGYGYPLPNFDEEHINVMLTLVGYGKIDEMRKAYMFAVRYLEKYADHPSILEDPGKNVGTRAILRNLSTSGHVKTI